MVPALFTSLCKFSAVLADMDLGSGENDHQAVGLQLGWDFIRRTRTQTRRRMMINRSLIKGNAGLSQYTPMSCWSCDIESQVDRCNSLILGSLMTTTKQTGGQQPKKPFLDEEAWRPRGLKNHHKHKVGKIDQALRKDLLWTLFDGWKHSQVADCFPTPTLCTGYRHLLYASRLKHGTSIAMVSRKIRGLLRLAKQSFVTNTVANIPESASQCWPDLDYEMKPCIGTSNSRKRNRPCLPFVLDAQGEVCTSADDARNRWFEFFAAMEGGVRIGTTEQRDLWIDNLQSFCADAFSYPLHELPTLFDLECALRRVRQGKATGADEVPSEVCGSHPLVCFTPNYSSWRCTDRRLSYTKAAVWWWLIKRGRLTSGHCVNISSPCILLTCNLSKLVGDRVFLSTLVCRWF